MRPPGARAERKNNHRRRPVLTLHLPQRYPKHQGAYSVRADPARPVWTHSSVGAGALQAVPFPGCDTVYATFAYAVAKNASRPAVGTRALLKVRHTQHCRSDGWASGRPALVRARRLAASGSLGVALSAPSDKGRVPAAWDCAWGPVPPRRACVGPPVAGWPRHTSGASRERRLAGQHTWSPTHTGPPRLPSRPSLPGRHRPPGSSRLPDGARG